MVARARACGVLARVCVRESVRAFVCACYCQDAVTKIHKHIFVNINLHKYSCNKAIHVYFYHVL